MIRAVHSLLGFSYFIIEEPEYTYLMSVEELEYLEAHRKSMEAAILFSS